jgi:hypothetical protein
MSKIVNIGDLDLSFYHISFCSREIDIENYHIRFLENLTIRGQESQYRQVNTIGYKFPTVPF